MAAVDSAQFFEPRRAAVILPAAVILEQVMERLDVWAVRATRRWLRDWHPRRAGPQRARRARAGGFGVARTVCARSAWWLTRARRDRCLRPIP